DPFEHAVALDACDSLAAREKDLRHPSGRELREDLVAVGGRTDLCRGPRHLAIVGLDASECQTTPAGWCAPVRNGPNPCSRSPRPGMPAAAVPAVVPNRLIEERSAMRSMFKALSLSIALAAPLGLAIAKEPAKNVSAARHPNLAAAQKLMVQAFEKLEAA